MTTFDPALASLSASGAAMAALQPRVVAGSPWPLADRFGVEPEASWGPPEVLAHSAEMLLFWIGEIERVLDGAGTEVPFGRVGTDPLRLGVLERDRTLPARELFARIDAGLARYARRLPELDEAAAASVGVHPTRGRMTVAEMVDRFVVVHLAEHVEQLTTILDDAGV